MRVLMTHHSRVKIFDSTLCARPAAADCASLTGVEALGAAEQRAAVETRRQQHVEHDGAEETAQARAETEQHRGQHREVAHHAEHAPAQRRET